MSTPPRTAIFGLIGGAVLIAIAYALTATSSRDGDLGTPAQLAARTAPVGTVTPAAEQAPAPAAATSNPTPALDTGPGSVIYEKACVACHGTGAANAPEFGNKTAWEPRLAQGIGQLLQTTIAGKGAMPPRGTCADCSDDDLKAAIEYMLVRIGYEPVASQRNRDSR